MSKPIKRFIKKKILYYMPKANTFSSALIQLEKV